MKSNDKNFLSRSRSPKPKSSIDLTGNLTDKTHHLAAPTALRRCRSASPLLHRQLLLSIEQQDLVRKSWNRVPKAKIGNAIYMGMVTRCNSARTVFGDATSLNRHLRHFVGLLQCAVDNLNDVEVALQPWLEMIGKGHAGFAIRSVHWDAFGEALLAAVNEYIAPGRAHKDTLKAWMLLSSFLSDRLGAASKTAALSPLSTPRLQLITLMASPPQPL